MKKPFVLLAVGAFVLAACANEPATGTGPSGDATQTVLEAFAKTTEAGSGRMALDLAITSPQQSVDITGRAEYEMDANDLNSVREHVVLQIPSLAPGMAGGEVELIVVGGPVLYAKAPMLTPFLGATTPWVKLDPSRLPGGGGAGMGAAAGAADPAAALALISDAIDVRLVGSDTVDGVDATKYQATLDLVKVLPKLAALSPEAGAKLTPADLARITAELDKVGMRELPLDVWVDGDGYLKQLQLAIDAAAIADDPSAPSVSVTVGFSDIGEHFTIEAPPASQVTAISELTPMMGTTTAD